MCLSPHFSCFPLYYLVFFFFFLPPSQIHPLSPPLYTCALEEISQNKILLKRQIYLQLAGARVSPLMFYVKVKEDLLIKRWGDRKKRWLETNGGSLNIWERRWVGLFQELDEISLNADWPPCTLYEHSDLKGSSFYFEIFNCLPVFVTVIVWLTLKTRGSPSVVQKWDTC